MDKVKKLLERYVEWIAIVLGVGFLGWTVYGYILDKPVSSTVGSRTDVSPSEVDHLVWDGPGQTLKSAIDNKNPAVIPDPANDYPQLAVDSRKKVPDSVTQIFPAPYVPLTPSPDMIAANTSPAPSTIPGHVSQLPIAPPIINLMVSQGHSNVPAPVPVAPAPVADGAAPPPAAAPVGDQAVDKNWRTISGVIPVADLAKSFADCKIPEIFNSTAILRVTLIREERDGSGSWTSKPDVEIAPLDINPLQDLPPINANAAAQLNYFQWAEQHVELIAAPPFYKVLQGDVWYEPGTKSPNQVDLALLDDGFDPNNPGAFKGDPNSLTADEKKILDDYNAKQAAKKANKKTTPTRTAPSFNPEGESTPPGGTGGTSGGRGGRHGGSSLVADPDRDQQSHPPDGFAGTPNMGVPNGNDGPPPAPTGGDGSSTNLTLPKGSFNPASQANIKVWAHDATVEPGKTYRYKLRYALHNPVAQTMGLCVPQALAQQFYIVSKDSAWTDPVSVESDTNFYAIDTKHGVHFDIFKWKNGIFQMQSVQVNAGDMVGTVDPTSGTDFTTHWTLVDLREDPRDETNKTILLVSDNGTVLRKELINDQRSRIYRHLLEQYNTNKDKNPAGAPPAAGALPT